MDATMEQEVETLLTIRDVARECDARVHRVRYVVDELGITARRRVGMVRLWTRDQLPEIRAALARTAEGRGLIPNPV